MSTTFNATDIERDALIFALQLIRSYSGEPFAVQIARDALDPLDRAGHCDDEPDWIEIMETVDAAGTYTGQG